MMIGWPGFLLLGIAAGICSGLFGIGGGLIIVPALVLIWQYPQQAASGTSLVALLLPVSGFAVWNYWRSGRLTADNISSGLWIGGGIAIGALVGSQIAGYLSDTNLRRAFAVFMIIAALRMLWS